MHPPTKNLEGNVCVNCGWRVKTLYVQYSPGNIRLMRCENCKAIVDQYIECEFMIIFIDLILHKPKAYRHLIYNMLNLDASDIKGILWKSSLSYIILDACRFSLLVRSKDDQDSSRISLFAIWPFGKVLVDILFGNLLFICFLFLGMRILLNSSFKVTRFKGILVGVLISSYFKIFIVAMMAWEFPLSVLFIIDAFVLSSNTVALQVMTQLRTTGCIGLCFSVHAAKFLTNHWLLPLASGSSEILYNTLAAFMWGPGSKSSALVS